MQRRVHFRHRSVAPHVAIADEVAAVAVAVHTQRRNGSRERV